MQWGWCDMKSIFPKQRAQYMTASDAARDATERSFAALKDLPQFFTSQHIAKVDVAEKILRSYFGQAKYYVNHRSDFGRRPFTAISVKKTRYAPGDKLMKALEEVSSEIDVVKSTSISGEVSYIYRLYCVSKPQAEVGDKRADVYTVDVSYISGMLQNMKVGTEVKISLDMHNVNILKKVRRRMSYLQTSQALYFKSKVRDNLVHVTRVA